MLSLLLAAIVAVYFVVAVRLSRKRFPGKPLKAWAATMAGFFLIFVADHLIGLAYAYTWVRMVPTAPALPIVTDNVLVEFEVQDPNKGTAAERESELLVAYVMTMVSSEGSAPTAGGLKGSYARLQGVLSTERGPKVVDLAAVADSKSEACQFFNSMPAEIQNRWRTLAAKGLENGGKAACVAISHALGLRAEFLYRVVDRSAGTLEMLLGIVDAASSAISELPSGRVLVEHRTMLYAGGWVQRTFWTSPSTGKPSAVSFETSGPIPVLRPAAPQRVLPALPKEQSSYFLPLQTAMARFLA